MFVSAILASEDKNFFSHEGVDKAAIVRAFKSDALWTMGQLDQLMPKLLEAKQANDARAAEGAKPEQG